MQVRSLNVADSTGVFRSSAPFFQVHTLEKAQEATGQLQEVAGGHEILSCLAQPEVMSQALSAKRPELQTDALTFKEASQFYAPETSGIGMVQSHVQGPGSRVEKLEQGLYKQSLCTFVGEALSAFLIFFVGALRRSLLLGCRRCGGCKKSTRRILEAENIHLPSSWAGVFANFKVEQVVAFLVGNNV